MLGGCKKGGRIRWHHLATEEEVLSSDFRDGCLNTYVVSVGIEVISRVFALSPPLIVACRNLAQALLP